MPNLRKKREQNRGNYIENQESKKAAARASYNASPENKRAASRGASRASYNASPENKRAASRRASRASYRANPENKRAASLVASRASYRDDPEKKRAASRVASRASYRDDPEKKRAASRVASRASYRDDPEKKRAASRVASRASYRADPHKKKAAARMHYVKTASAKIKWYKKYYSKCRGGICASKRARYALAEPRPIVKELYGKEIQCRLLGDDGAKVELLQAFRRHYKSAAKRLPQVMVRSVCKIAAKRLRNKALQLRKEHSGALLKTTRAVRSLDIQG